MAQNSGYWSGTTPGDAGAYSSETYREVIDYYFRNQLETNRRAIGYLPGTANTAANMPLKVTESSPTALSVVVELGVALVLGFWYELDANETLAIASNTSGNDRIDSIVLTTDWAAQTVRLAVVQGTPAGSPVAPTLTQNEGTLWQHKIADVTVVNGTSAITNANIDTSANVPIQRVNEAIRTTASSNASSTFSALWDGNQIQVFPIPAVEYTDSSALFLTPNEGTTWYRVEGEYTNTTHAEQSTTSDSITFVNIGTPITLTATRDHVYVAFTIYGDNAGSLREMWIRGTVNVAGTDVLLALGSADGQSTSARYCNITLAGRIPCNAGDTITITGQLASTVGSGANKTAYIRGISSV